MPAVIQARLIDGNQAPLRGLVVRVVAWTLAGRVKSLVEGKTDSTGSLALAIDLDPGQTSLPRLGLQQQSGTRWLELGDSPIKVAKDLFEFGTLVVSDTPALQLGTRKIYALSEPAYALTAKALASEALAKKLAPQALPQAAPSLPSLEDLPKSVPELQDALLDALDKQGKLGALTEELQAKANQFEGQVAELGKLKQALEAQLAQRDKSLGESQAKLDDALATLADLDQATGIVDVVQDLGGQLGSAAKTIDDAALGMMLGDVSIHLKGIGTSGGKFEFPTINKLKYIAGAEMSSIDLAFHPRRPPLGAEPAPDKPPGMPSVLGYTELLARRKLEQLSLALEISHKAVAKPASGPSPWGRVVAQSPAPGAAIAVGTKVEILIGKPIETDS